MQKNLTNIKSLSLRLHVTSNRFQADFEYEIALFSSYKLTIFCLLILHSVFPLGYDFNGGHAFKSQKNLVKYKKIVKLPSKSPRDSLEFSEISHFG